ncbi:MAG: hypothetical protein BGO98_41210 [Myxococcales bacterium 68-20]|nr:MAG: hypothetical protein BGO98_41210 [Myxococcales bacterium 68-20]
MTPDAGPASGVLRWPPLARTRSAERTGEISIESGVGAWFRSERGSPTRIGRRPSERSRVPKTRSQSASAEP